MLIDCTHCQARINAEVIQCATYRDQIFWTDSYKLALLRCPQCEHLLAGQQWLMKPAESDDFGNEVAPEEWWQVSRVWPDPVSELALSIPEMIRTCLQEAEKCLHATAYSACIAMSGRALEAMCRHFATHQTMFEGLKELHDKGIIDRRLWAWGDELRTHRNLAAHATDAKFSLADAKDLYDFATAICDYVFVLSAKFETFKKRQAKAADTTLDRAHKKGESVPF